MNMKIDPMFVTLQNSWPGYYDRVAICDHIMQGYIPGSYARFNNPNEEVSAHFGVGINGQVVQFVDMGRSAWANGILEQGWDQTIKWLSETVKQKLRINTRTISIEHEGQPGETMPEPQYQATLALHKYIITTWPTIKPDRQHIIGHNQITPQSRAHCPSDAFPFDRLITDLQKEFSVMDTARKVPGSFPVRAEFTNFWFNRGGLAVFGYPLEAERDANGKYGKAVKVQFFERSRFELQPDFSVILGLVGQEAINWRSEMNNL